MDGNSEEEAVNVDDNDEDDEKKQEKRKFQPKWLQLYNWLERDEKQNKMFCKICHEFEFRVKLITQQNLSFINIKLEH